MRRLELSEFASRVEDLVAEKLEKMFFESLRGLGEAGDCGMSCTVGVAASGSPPFMAFGEEGLNGLMGEFMFSLPPFARMAKDREDDLGIFLSGFRDVSQG